MKADHGDEVGFVFGGPYLAGDIQLCGEEQNIQCSLTNYARNIGIVLFGGATSILIRLKYIYEVSQKYNPFSC